MTRFDRQDHLSLGSATATALPAGSDLADVERRPPPALGMLQRPVPPRHVSRCRHVLRSLSGRLMHLLARHPH
jgi:hypothetical protein